MPTHSHLDPDHLCSAHTQLFCLWFYSVSFCFCLYIQNLHSVSACRMPDEDAQGTSQHCQIRTWQNLCSGWLILHKARAFPCHCLSIAACCGSPVRLSTGLLDRLAWSRVLTARADCMHWCAGLEHACIHAGTTSSHGIFATRLQQGVHQNATRHECVKHSMLMHSDVCSGFCSPRSRAPAHP